MIRLALAAAFLTVFGFAAYAITLLLTDYFKKKNNPPQNIEEPTEQPKDQSIK